MGSLRRGRLAKFLLAAAMSVAGAAHAQSVDRTIPAAAGEAIAVNGSSMIAYVTNAAANRVAVVDQTGATTYVAVGRNPRYIAVSNYTIYVSNTTDASLSVIREGAASATTLPINGAGPIVTDPTRNKVYVLRQGNNGEVTVVDGNTLAWYAIDTGSHTPADLAVNPNTQRLYVSHNLSGDVRAIDLTSTSDHPPNVSIQIAGRPGAIAVNPLTNKVYVLSDDARGPIVAIDGDTNATVPITAAGHMIGPRAIAVNTRTDTIYAGFANELAIVDAKTRNLTFVPTAEILSIYPDNEGGKTYVLDAARNLHVIDGFTNAIVTVPIGSESRAVAYIYKTQVAMVTGPVLTWVRSGSPPDAGTPNINAQGLWWGLDGSESGWGINITHQGHTLFATWFTYDSQGQGMWLVMSNGIQHSGNAYSGPLYRTTGPPFSSASFDSTKVVRVAVGTADISISNANNAMLTATVDGVTIRKAISRQIFASPVPSCAQDGIAGSTPYYQDLWWNSPAGSESGWGINIAHQGDILFVTWFTYDAAGRGLWLVGSNVAKTGNATYSGTLYRTFGPPFTMSPWDPARVSRVPAGAITLAFSDSSHATMSYTVDGVSQSKAITRQVFATPATICR